MRAKVVPEFRDEFGVVSEPRCITAGGKRGFKPVERSSMEKRQYIIYLSTVIGECVGTVVEVQETLCYDCNTKSTLVSPVTPVTSPDLISYSGSSS